MQTVWQLTLADCDGDCGSPSLHPSKEAAKAEAVERVRNDFGLRASLDWEDDGDLGCWGEVRGVTGEDADAGWLYTVTALPVKP
jgi:hypothetical protein